MTVNSETEYKILKEFLWRLEAITADPSEKDSIALMLQAAISDVNGQVSNRDSLNWINGFAD